MLKIPTHSQTAGRHPQRGLALLVALLVLVAMSIAGIALVRSVDTASLIAGNIAFRQGATLAGDAGIEAARTYLLGGVTTSALENDQSGSGYYATRQDLLDLTGNRTPGVDSDNVQWPDTSGNGPSPACLANPDSAGNRVCYIVNRMCRDVGPITPENCSAAPPSTRSFANSKGIVTAEVSYKGRDPTLESTTMTSSAYYRVTVRIAGPRNNVSFVQAFLLI